MFLSRSLALAAGARVRLVENMSAPAQSPRVVCIGVGDLHVGPSVGGVAAVKRLGLVGLGDGYPRRSI